MPDEISAKQQSSRWLLRVIGFVLVLAIVGGVLAIRGSRLPRLDRARFDAARARWDENRESDYEISIQVKGRQPGVYEVQVQQGIATTAKLDGRALTRPRTFGTWSVDGMFETISRDLDNQEVLGNLLLGARFDETHGFPLRYERIEMQSGVHDALHWEVFRFVAP